VPWTPRSERIGKHTYDGPFEGVPAHLKPHLVHWLRETLVGTGKPRTAVNFIALRLS
jgi:hypothetical protein